jgi:hypothetical protein
LHSHCARYCACAAPTRVPTPAPTNVGDTNPPTRATTFAPTRGPNFADPTGESDAIDATYLPSLPPFPPFLLPPPPPLPALHSVGPSPRRVTALHALEAPWLYGASLSSTRAYAATEGYIQGTTTVPNKVKERYTSPLNRLYGAHTVLRPPPAEHARLLRVLAAVCVGRSGQCTAVWGTPAYGSCGMALSSAHWVLTGYSDGTHTGPVCTAAKSWAHATQCSACVRHHGVDSKVGERHRTEGGLACDARRVLDGYSSTEYRAHRSAPVRQHCGGFSGHIKCTRTVRVCACAAPTRVPTPAPTNVGDTNPPTRAPTRGPNFADPTGEGDAIGATCLPSLPPFPPFSSRHPRRSLHCIALGPPPGA